MCVIEMNGVKVEADTLKAAEKLARKEARRQATAEAEKDKKRDLARLHCYAQIGHWAEHLEYNERIPPAHAPYPKGIEYGDSFFRRQVTPGEDGSILCVESPLGKATWSCWGYTVTALIENGAGYLFGAKLQSRTRPEDTYYVTLNAVDDVAALAQVPKFIGAALDKALAERLERHTKKEATK